MTERPMWSLIILSMFLVALTSCANPQPLPVAPTAIPTLIPATLPPEPTATLRPVALGVTFPSRQPSARSASALYQQNCASCHGVDGKGLVPNARNFSDADYMRGQSPLRFYQIISDGRGEMPPWQDTLSVDERWDLAFAIWSFATSAETLDQGKAIFQQNCATCHGPDGKGVVPGTPDFTNVEWIAGEAPSDFFQVVTEGRGTMPSWQGRLSPDERWAAIEYMRTFAYEPAISPGAATSGQAPSASSPTQEPAAAIPALYVEKGCVACHGDKAQGLVGPIVAGLPVEHVKSMVRSGDLEGGMPPFDQKTLSEDDLDTLAQALNSLTLQDAGVELAQSVLDHLNQAWDALQAGDQGALETHLKKAQAAAADAPPGVQATLNHMVEHMEENEGTEYINMRLAFLLQK